jgi:WNK lysine deficient protein kinase
MAPEMYEEEYNYKVDIWAFGMCVLEMATGHIPYYECQNTAQVYKKASSPPHFQVTSQILPAGVELIKYQQLKDFIHACLQFNINERPSARELRDHT